MKVNQHVYAIKNLISAGPSSDDLRITNALILHFLNVVRSRLIKDTINKYFYISDQSYQNLCVKLQKSSFHECCNITFDYCPILKSTLPLPTLLQSKFGNNMKVTDLEGRILPEINLTQVLYSKYSDLPPITGYFINNNHLFIVGNTSLDTVLINALFDDPEAIQEINCPSNTGEDCAYLEAEFPIDSDLVAMLYEMTLNLLFIHLKIPNDITNNAREDRQGEVRRES